jgi:hypothetical protein
MIHHHAHVRVATVSCALDADELNAALESESRQNMVEQRNGGSNVIDEDVDHLSQSHKVDGETIAYNTCS